MNYGIFAKCMHKRFLQYKNARICYYLSGEGSQVVFCFHGYSNNARLFELLEDPLSAGFKLIAIDLPYHGQTSWPRKALKVEILSEIMKAILQQERLPEKYWLVGFSLGARVCMRLFQYNAVPVGKMILLSPDGLYTSIWYHFLVRTTLGHRLMAYLLKSPKKAMPALNWCRKAKIINAAVYNFAQGFVHSKRESTLLYARWVSMSNLHPSMKAFNRKMLDKKVPVYLIFGKSDQITPRQNAQELRRFHNPYMHVEIWDAGHLLIRDKYLPKLLTLFQSPAVTWQKKDQMNTSAI